MPKNYIHGVGYIKSISTLSYYIILYISNPCIICTDLLTNMYLCYHLFLFRNVIIVKIHMPVLIPLAIHDHIDVKDRLCQKYRTNNLTATLWLTILQKQ